MKELARNARSTFSAGDFHSADHILAAVGFFEGFSKRISPKLFVISGSKFQSQLKLLCFLIFRDFILLASSDNDAHMLMRQKCKHVDIFISGGP